MSTLESRTEVHDDDGFPTVHVILRPGERVHVIACDSGCGVGSRQTGEVAGIPVALVVEAERFGPVPKLTTEDPILAAMLGLKTE